MISSLLRGVQVAHTAAASLVLGGVLYATNDFCSDDHERQI